MSLQLLSFVPASHFGDHNMLFHLGLLVFISAVSAAVSPPLQTIDTQLWTTNGSGITLPFHATVICPGAIQLSNGITLGSTEVGVARAARNARSYGSNLNIASCEKAYRNIIPDDEDESFGSREDGHDRYRVGLPYQWLTGR